MIRRVKNLCERYRQKRAVRKRCKDIKQKLCMSHVLPTSIEGLYLVSYCDFAYCYDGDVDLDVSHVSYNLWNETEQMYMFNRMQSKMEKLTDNLYLLDNCIYDISIHRAVYSTLADIEVKKRSGDMLLMCVRNELVLFNLKTKQVQKGTQIVF